MSSVMLPLKAPKTFPFSSEAEIANVCVELHQDSHTPSTKRIKGVSSSVASSLSQRPAPVSSATENVASSLSQKADIVSSTTENVASSLAQREATSSSRTEEMKQKEQLKRFIEMKQKESERLKRSAKQHHLENRKLYAESRREKALAEGKKSDPSQFNFKKGKR